MRILKGKSKTGLNNGLATIRRCLQSSKCRRGVHKRTYLRPVPIPVPGSIRMTPKKKKKTETYLIPSVNTSLMMRR